MHDSSDRAPTLAVHVPSPPPPILTRTSASTLTPHPSQVTEAQMTDERSPWHAWRWWPGPWAAFEGIGADRLVLGKPGCNNFDINVTHLTQPRFH